MKISKNFSLSELTHSDTAIAKGINNTPSDSEINNLKILIIKLLQPIRDLVGKSVTISSGFRSKELNKTLRGAKTSHHMNGMAADLVFEGMDEIFPKIVNNMVYTQVILEKSGKRKWIHVSYDNDNLKGEALTYNDGKYEFYE